jgi:hypothetical protein
MNANDKSGVMTSPSTVYSARRCRSHSISYHIPTVQARVTNAVAVGTMPLSSSDDNLESLQQERDLSASPESGVVRAAEWFVQLGECPRTETVTAASGIPLVLA